MMSNMADFQAHFKMWWDREQELVGALNAAIAEAAQVNVCLYKELLCILTEVQDEQMRLEMCYNSLEFGGFHPHDVSVKSKWLHDYFEHEYKNGQPINFNIG